MNPARRLLPWAALFAGAALVAAGTWVVALRFQSPAQRKAAASPPPAGRVTVQVTRGDLTEQTTVLATAARSEAVSVAIAALTLVTTIMVSSVMGRTGEIGLRRAIGARRVHIRVLIASEAGLTGLLGGAAGAYLGILAILAITIGRGWQPVVDRAAVPAGIAGGVAVSLLSAVFATHRASRVEPSEALHQ